VGRIGTNIALALHAAGVGEISCNDPQNFEEEQLTVCVFSRQSDIGRPKVHVLERFLDGRPNLTFTPIVAVNQSPKVRPYLERANVLVSCANDLDARLYLERMAIKLKKPCVQASVHDARTAVAGAVTVWMPGTDSSCFGCLFPGRKQVFHRGEILLPTVTGATAVLAANVVVDLLALDEARGGRRRNLFSIDLRSYSVEAISVASRPGCKICGSANPGTR